MNETPQDILDRRARAFTLLTEQGLELCADLKDAALETQDLHAKAELALAHQRVGRSIRQTLALEARLLHGEGQLAREREDAAQAQVRAARHDKVAKVRSGVHRLVWTEAEREELDEDETEALIDRADKLIDFDADAGVLHDEPLEAAVTRLAREVGIKLAPSPEAEPAQPAPAERDYWDSA